MPIKEITNLTKFKAPKILTNKRITGHSAKEVIKG